MKKIILGDRKGELCYISLHLRTRVGDLAGLDMCMGEWRLHNPDKRLIVFYDPFSRIHEYSRQMPIDWVFETIADEVWIKENGDKGITIPGRQIYDFFLQESPVHLHLWESWYKLRRSRTFNPTIKMRKDVLEIADNHLKQYKVPEKFVVVQALFDAGYHKYRNAPILWWIHVCNVATRMGLPIVLIGPTRWMGNPSLPEGVYPLFKTVSNPYEAMAIGSRARVFIGGETGLPLWEPFFQVPVIAAFRHWRLDSGKYDYRPISFGAPVIFAQLEADPKPIANAAYNIVSGKTIPSTPAN